MLFSQNALPTVAGGKMSGLPGRARHFDEGLCVVSVYVDAAVFPDAF